MRTCLPACLTDMTRPSSSRSTADIGKKPTAAVAKSSARKFRIRTYAGRSFSRRAVPLSLIRRSRGGGMWSHLALAFLLSLSPAGPAAAAFSCFIGYKFGGRPLLAATMNGPVGRVFGTPRHAAISRP